MRISRFILGSLIAAGAAYTIAYFIRQSYLLKTISLSPAGIKVHKLGEKTSITVMLKLENKSDLGITISGANLRASINGIPAADIAVQHNVKVRPQSDTLIPADLNFNLFQAINSLKGGVSTAKLQGLSAVTISLKGTVSLSTGILFYRMPVDMKFNAGDLIKT